MVTPRRVGVMRLFQESVHPTFSDNGPYTRRKVAFPRQVAIATLLESQQGRRQQGNCGPNIQSLLKSPQHTL